MNYRAQFKALIDGIDVDMAVTLALAGSLTGEQRVQMVVAAARLKEARDLIEGLMLEFVR